jgi:hypothetical protein
MLLKRLLLCCSLLISFRDEGYAMTVYLLSNHGNVGDHNQVLGIFTALQSLSQQDLGVKDFDTKTTSPAVLKEAIEKDLTHEKVIVMGAGEGGIDGIADLSSNPNLIICLSSHMFLERYKDPALLEKVSFIALPTHVSANIKKRLGRKLIETVGVAHNRHPAEATKVYEAWEAKELPSSPTYLGVILGGDAPVPESKEIKLFSEEDANNLAEYIANNAKGAYILVLNGPRTGKYDKNRKEISTIHKKGQADSITNFFKAKLSKKGIAKVKIFDFQHNTPENKAWVSPYNCFDLVAGALKATGGKILVPGESSTSISESVDVLSPTQVIVYKNNAMNEVHKDHVASEFAAGRISILEDYQTVRSGSSPSKETSPAALTIAQKLLKESR